MHRFEHFACGFYGILLSAHFEELANPDVVCLSSSI